MTKKKEQPTSPTTDNQIRNQTAKTFTQRSKTKQSFKDACDINLIMKRHAAGDQVFHLNAKNPVYGDFTDANDLHVTMNRVKDAEAQFAALPAAVRAACDNQPAKLLHLIEDPDQALILAELGATELVEALHGPLEPLEPVAPAVAPQETPQATEEPK